MLETPKKKTLALTAHLTMTEKERLEKLAEFRKVRVNDIINTMIQSFEFNWDDITFFHGGKRKGMLETVKGFFNKPEDKMYMTFEVKPENFKRVTDYRNKYDMLSGKIITHMVQKYLKYNRGG